MRGDSSNGRRDSNFLAGAKAKTQNILETTSKEKRLIPNKSRAICVLRPKFESGEYFGLTPDMDGLKFEPSVFLQGNNLPLQRSITRFNRFSWQSWGIFAKRIVVFK